MCEIRELRMVFTFYRVIKKGERGGTEEEKEKEGKEEYPFATCKA